MPMTSASMTLRVLLMPQHELRIGWAMSAGASAAEATWYSSGWNR